MRNKQPFQCVVLSETSQMFHLAEAWATAVFPSCFWPFGSADWKILRPAMLFKSKGLWRIFYRKEVDLFHICSLHSLLRYYRICFVGGRLTGLLPEREAIKNEKILTGRLSGFWESLNYQSTSARPPLHISGKLGSRWIWDSWRQLTIHPP